MKTPAILALLFLLLPLVGTSSPASNLRVQIDLQLRDGTRVSSFFRDSQLRFTTRVGDVPIAEIERFQVKKGGEELILTWKNGDRLEAGFSAGVFEIESRAGTLDVPLVDIARGRVRLVEGPDPLVPVAVRVSGQYAHHKTEYAFDGEIAQAWSSGAWGGWIEFDLGDVHVLERVITYLQFGPDGQAVHEIFVSDEPIETDRSGAKLVQRFSGHRHNHSVLTAVCAPNVSGRYVQVHCSSSRSWFNVRELQIFARE